MPIDATLAGRSYPPTPPYHVGREKIREFADAVGDTSPACRDPEAARLLGHPDVIAPPTFPIVVTLRAAEQVLADPSVGVVGVVGAVGAVGVEMSRVVHGDQRFTATRPVRAGDQLVVETTVDRVREMAGNAIITVRGEVRTTAGEHVCTSSSTLVVRGAAAAEKL
ncbi:MAG: MaoC family dehydratase N-terminal domain-containing protein [Acidothermales bacterium]|nr:MaoC family dehydratase N-terminal domain-containing protein [Acidothermales bacterium]